MPWRRRQWCWGGVLGFHLRLIPTVELTWEACRAVIATLRVKGLPSMLEHADLLGHQLDQHPSAQRVVGLNLSEDADLRSFNWARVELRPTLGREPRA